MQTDAVAHELWNATRALPEATRKQLLEKMLADAALRGEFEELLDLAIVEERPQEPSRPLSDVFSETA